LYYLDLEIKVLIDRSNSNNAFHDCHFSYFVILFLICFLMGSSLLGRSSDDPFSINITVDYLEIQLLDNFDNPYDYWWIFEVAPGDTVGMTYGQVVHLVNNCNVPVDIVSTVEDSPDTTTIDTIWTPWTAWVTAGTDEFVFLWACYSTHVMPDLADANIVLSSSSNIENGVLPGEDRYLYAWLFLPLDGIEGERHRLISTIQVMPSGFTPARSRYIE